MSVPDTVPPITVSPCASVLSTGEVTRLHSMSVPFSGSVAVKVTTGSVPFSAYSPGASPSRSGFSSTFFTTMFTVVSVDAPDGSVAMTVTS